MVYPIISSEELRKVSEAIVNGYRDVEVSFDLGFSGETEIVNLTKEGFVYKNHEIKLPNIRDDDKSCYLVLDNGVLEKVQYSAGEGIYKLIPTQFRPILQISGTSMHKQAFIERLEKYKFRGHVLDSGTGLGYTAIVVARTAKKVTTIEFDKMVLDIQKINPYSQGLFVDKINLVHGDLVEEVKKFSDGEFNFIILDGGTPRSSGDFFSEENYAQIFRVLRRGGKIFHYVPNYHINRGIDFAENVSRKLKKVGFRRVERDKEGSFLEARK